MSKVQKPHGVMFLSFLLTISFSNLTFAITDEVGRNGLKPLTPEELTKLNKRKIVKVHLNKVALKRINKHRNKIGLPELPESSVSKKEIDIEEESTNQSLSGATTTTTTSSGTLLSSLPAQVDNSTLVAFPNIGNQGAEGSCVAFASTYYMMSHEVCLTLGCDNKNASAKIYSPKWTYNMINGGVDGGSYFSDAFSMIQNHGAPTLSELPYYAGDYRAWDLNPDHWLNAISSKISPVSYITINTDAGMSSAKQMLLNGHVLVLGTYINSWVFSTIASNPNSSNNSFVGQSIAHYLNGRVGGHAMTLVGYDDKIWTDINGNGLVEQGELGAFKIANSWGAGWRNGGYVWASYDAFRATSSVPNFLPATRVQLTQSGSVYSNTFTPYSPKLLARVTASHLSRNQMNLKFASSSTSSTTPQSYWYPTALANKSGAYAFNGSTTEIEGTFYFDISSLLTSTVDQQLFYLLSSDNTVGNALTIKAFEIIDPSTRNVIYSASNVPMVTDGNSKNLIVGNYTADTIAPSAPINLAGTIISKKQGRNVIRSIKLSWSASTDNVGVAKYFIYRNGIKIGESTSLSFSDSSGTAGVSYTYEVAAVDAQANISLKSNLITISK